jgi:hypothetical protein
MRTRDGLIAIVTLTLGLAASTGAVWSNHFPLPVQAEAHGFDALAHAVFGPMAGGAGGRQRQQEGQ